MSANEQAISDDIHDELIAAGIDPTQLTWEVDRDHVVVRGEVRDRVTRERVMDVIEQVAGVRSVCDQVVARGLR